MKLQAYLSMGGLMASAVAASTPTASSSPATSTSASNYSYPYPIYQLSTDSEFAFLFEELLALSNGGGAATGEILRIASQVVPGDFESWYKVVKNMSDQLSEMEKTIDPKRFPVSVRELNFRSSAYLRHAPFFLHGNQSDPRIADAWAKQIPMFDKAISLLDVPGRRYNISAGNFTVPIIFFPASNDPDCKRPTILAGSGYDGSQEDLYHGIGVGALARGYNFVTYEGPGQPTVRLQQNLGFIHDWWNVVTPVVDFLEKQPNVDKDQLALIGESFGGTLAPLVTTHEKRFAATIAIDGLISIRDAIQEQFIAGGLGPVIDAYNAGNRTQFDTIIRELQTSPQSPTELKWLIDQSLWSFDTTSPYDWWTRLGAFSLQNVTDQIPGPVYDAYGENDALTGNQAILFQKALGDRSTFHDFPIRLGAGEHCQLGAEPYLSQEIYGWLADVLARKNATQSYKK